jgi:hypothetical protein
MPILIDFICDVCDQGYDSHQLPFHGGYVVFAADPDGGAIRYRLVDEWVYDQSDDRLLCPDCRKGGDDDTD